MGDLEDRITEVKENYKGDTGVLPVRASKKGQNGVTPQYDILDRMGCDPIMSPIVSALRVSAVRISFLAWEGRPCHS